MKPSDRDFHLERPGTWVGVVNQRLGERLEKEPESRNPKIGNCPIRSPFNKQKRLSSPSQECHKIETSSQVRPFCSGATRLNYVEKFVFRRVADESTVTKLAKALRSI